MIVYPAVDLKDGQVVRLLRGDLSASTVYGDNPGETAKRWADLGFPWLHIVDLNGAVEGRPVNAGAIADIVAQVKGQMQLQLGGGIRTLAQVEAWLEAGISRVILGSIALRAPALVKAAAKAFPGQVVVGIDARNGRVASDGWLATSDTWAVDLARQFEASGVAAIIYTDIDRDGALTGVNVAATAQLAAVVSIPVIASGGLKGPEDLQALQAADVPIAGVVSGRALYDGRLDPADALKVLSWA